MPAIKRAADKGYSCWGVAYDREHGYARAALISREGPSCAPIRQSLVRQLALLTVPRGPVHLTVR